MALQPGFFQREPREHLRERRKKTEYFDDFARQFAPVARKTITLVRFLGFFQREPREKTEYFDDFV